MTGIEVVADDFTAVRYDDTFEEATQDQTNALLTSVTCLLQLNVLLNRLIPTHNSLPNLFVVVKTALLVLTFLTALLTTPSFLPVELTLSDVT